MKILWIGWLPLFLSLLLLLAACSTTAKVSGTAELPALSTSSVGAAIPFRFEAENSVWKNGCTMSLRRNDDVKTFEVHFPAGRDVVFAELPEGIYGFHEIYCGARHWDLSYRKWPRFRVYPNSISLTGGFAFSLEANGRLNLRLSPRSDNRLEALSFFGRLPAMNRDRVVSGYTQKLILPEALEKPARWKNWERTDATGNHLKKVAPEWPTFRACYQGESDVNSLWLGNLEVTATYENGAPIKIEATDTWHTFTDHFRECVKATLQDFHPRHRARILYKLYI